MESNIINTTAIHKKFIADKKQKIVKLKEVSFNYKKSKDILSSIILTNKERINSCSNIKVNDLHIGTNTKNIKFNNIAEKELSKVEITFLTNTIIDYVNIYKQYVETIEEIKKLEFLLIKLKQFNFICSEFNYRLIDCVIEKKPVNLGDKLGYIEIQCKKRKNFNKVVINWGESNKNKKKIIESGGTPLLSVKNEDGTITTNGGIPWKVEHLDLHRLFIAWRPTRGKEFFRFFPTAQSTYRKTSTQTRLTFVKRLKKYEKENPDYIKEFIKEL